MKWPLPDGFAIRRQVRVTSVHSWYLTSFLILSFIVFGCQLPHDSTLRRSTLKTNKITFLDGEYLGFRCGSCKGGVAEEWSHGVRSFKGKFIFTQHTILYTPWPKQGMIRGSKLRGGLMCHWFVPPWFTHSISQKKKHCKWQIVKTLQEIFVQKKEFVQHGQKTIDKLSNMW